MTVARQMAGAACALLLAAAARGQGTESERVTVRVLPQAAPTNAAPLRLGLQLGFLEGPGNPFRAESLSAENVEAESHAKLKVADDPNSGRRLFRVANGGDSPAGVALTSGVLRRGVGCTVRARCRPLKGGGSLRLTFGPVGGGPGEMAVKSVTVRGSDFSDALFQVMPQTEGAYRCAFQLAPGGEMEFASFSLVPEDAEEGWSRPALEALRTLGPGALRWPVHEGVGFYNWYDGVGPRALRRPVTPTARAEDGHDFGTAEFVGFCRLVGAQPLVRVPLYWPGCDGERLPDLESAVRLAADWVAYCNAANGHPLATLRARHGQAAALGISRWELVPPEGQAPDGADCRAYVAAMKAEDPLIEVGVSVPRAADLARVLEGAGGALDFVSCGEPDAGRVAAACDAKGGARIKRAATRLEGRRDRYVEQVWARLAVADRAEQRYYGAWYDALALANAALDRLRAGAGGPVCAPCSPEQLLCRGPDAQPALTETGLLVALFNRFPAQAPVVCEGAPGGEGAPFRVEAAWTEDRTALAVYIYNSGPEPRALRLDLTPLKRRFAFWTSDLLAADIAAKRQSETVPVYRRQKAGSALSQMVPCEAAPASLTRIIVKE